MLARGGGWKRLLPAGIAALPVLLAGTAWIAVYNRAVTGDPLQLPYLLHDRLYNAGPVFWFLPLRPEPHYDQPRLAATHGLNGWEVQEYHRVRRGLAQLLSFRMALRGLMKVLGPLFGLVLLAPLGWRDERCRYLLPVILIGYLASSVVVWQFSHYLAPEVAACLLLAACTADSAAMSAGSWGRRWWALAAVALSFVYGLGMTVYGLVRPGHFMPPQVRSAMLEQVRKGGGKQLVLVRYEPNVSEQVEWVYNGADIDSQNVILAHDLGPAEDLALERDYHDRTIWSVTVAQDGVTDLVSYTLLRVQR